MRYTYDVYREQTNPESKLMFERFDTFTTNRGLRNYFDEKGDKLQEFAYIQVTDNLRRRSPFTIMTAEQFDEWWDVLSKIEIWPQPMNSETASQQTLADNNVKTAAAVGKPKLSVVPPIGMFALGAAMENGADKYGAFNWRETAVTSSVFFDAMLRHLIYWYCGENKAADSKVHHLGHTMAGGAIILDAELFGVLKDDRNHGARDPEELLKKMFEIIKG